MKIETMAITVEVEEIEKIKSLLAEIKVSGGKKVRLDLIEDIENSLNNLKEEDTILRLSGKAAGICYMQEDYFDGVKSGGNSAVKRGEATLRLGHHSIGDHGNITLLLGGIPKIIAMLLNNTRYYTTSEKSARYTKMQPETDLELNLYNKWTKKYYNIIKDKYPKLDEKTVEKLAMENARYLISVFTPTTMAYTTSYRQISYIMDWCDKLKDTFKNVGGNNNFYNRLTNELQKFKELLMKEVDVQLCFDIKNRGFDLMLIDKPEDKEIIDDVYILNYKATFAEVAQAQRHRTLNYQIYLDNLENKYYVPNIIKGTDHEQEWLQDINSISYCIPQGTLVDVVERGTIENFMLKAKERMCGRAQLEICNITEQQMQLFLDNKHKLSRTNQDLVDRHTLNGSTCTKCLMDNFKCNEVCHWGNRNGLTRLI